MVMTLEKNRAEFWGLGEVESCESERPQGFSVSWGKTNWNTIDANGNCVNDGVRTYGWDGENRLVGVTFINPQPIGVADNIQMAYDGKGRRVAITEKHGNSTLTDKRFVWCGDLPCQERDSSGSTISRQFFELGERVGSNNYYFTNDHLFNVREMLDANGNIQARYDYDPFGRQVKLSVSIDSDFGYTSFYTNRSSGLDLTLYRGYDPEKGRWLSRDPLYQVVKIALITRKLIDLNLYRFVKNNPIIFVDGLGLQAEGPTSPYVPHCGTQPTGPYCPYYPGWDSCKSFCTDDCVSCCQFNYDRDEYNFGPIHPGKLTAVEHSRNVANLGNCIQDCH